METAERQHAKRIEQTLASINKNLERIAKSLEKMEPTIYQLPKYKFPLDVTDIPIPRDRGPANDPKYLTTITADEENEDEKVFKSNTPTPDYWRDCLSDTFKP